MDKQISDFEYTIDFYNEVESSLKADMESYTRFVAKYPVTAYVPFDDWLDYKISDAAKAVRASGKPVTVQAVVNRLLIEQPNP